MWKTTIAKAIQNAKMTKRTPASITVAMISRMSKESKKPAVRMGSPRGSGNPVFCSATASLTAEFTDWRGCSCAFLFLAL